jgi:hypothetical protein
MCHSFIMNSNALSWPGISYLGTLGTLSFFKSSQNKLQKDLHLFPQQEITLHDYSQFLLKHVPLFNIKQNQPINSFKQNIVHALSNTLPSLVLPKYTCKNYLYSAYEFSFFSLACLTLTLPQDDFTSAHALQ